MDKPILDACCGSRMFWFNKENPNVVFLRQARSAISRVLSGKTYRN